MSVRGLTLPALLLSLLLLASLSPRSISASPDGPGWRPSSVILIPEQTGQSAAVGINDNGTAVINGAAVYYNYTVSALMGYFAFYSGSFYSGPPINQPAYSVQLNSNFNASGGMTLWAQNVFLVIYQNGVYNVSVVDNIWNSTSSGSSLNQSLVTGYGNFSTASGQVFYYDVAPRYYITGTPFYLYALMTINLSASGYPTVFMYYRFVNSTYDSGWIHYDTITVLVPTNITGFLTGLTGAYATAPFVTQWVVCGAGGASQLNVTGWNATMALYYQYNGKWYSVPDALSLQPSSFQGGVTGETVNQYYGIQEYYNNQTGLVNQTQGQNLEEFLWQPNVTYVVNGNTLTLYLTPPKGEWLINVTGIGYSNTTFGQYSPVSFTLQPGNYTVYATLYAGPNPVYTFTLNVTVS